MSQKNELAHMQVSQWEMLKDQAKILFDSRMLPDSVKTPHQALAIILKGREINMPPMQAFSHINIIQGKPTISAEGMLALIFKLYPKTSIKYIQNDEKACKIEVNKNGDKNIFHFTIEDAGKANLLGKQVWRQYPRAMLRSRVVSEMARSLFPEALMGISYTPEELGQDDDESAKDDEKNNKPAEPVIEAIPDEKPDEPEFYMEDKYNPSKPGHKKFLFTELTNLGVTEKEEMVRLAEIIENSGTNLGDIESRLTDLKKLEVSEG